MTHLFPNNWVMIYKYGEISLILSGKEIETDFVSLGSACKVRSDKTLKRESGLDLRKEAKHGGQDMLFQWRLHQRERD